MMESVPDPMVTMRVLGLDAELMEQLMQTNWSCTKILDRAS